MFAKMYHLILNSNTGWEKCIHSHPIEKKNQKGRSKKMFSSFHNPKDNLGFFCVFFVCL